MCITVTVVVLQAFALPFESVTLDKLQALILWTEFVLIAIGLMFGTEPGRGEWHGYLMLAFFAAFGFTAAIACLIIVRDILRYTKVQYIGSMNKKHDLKINPKEFIVTTLYHWLRRADSNQLAVFSDMQSIRAKCLESHRPVAFSH